MTKKTQAQPICKFYSYSQGQCYPVEFNDDRIVHRDVSTCPAIKAREQCKGFVYFGDKYKVLDHGIDFNR